MFKFLMFIDDNEGTNCYNQFIIDELKIAEKSVFFEKAEEALQYLATIKKSETEIYPDVIFLDINMPKINGWVFIEKYTQMKPTKVSPIIMLSTSLSPRDKEKVKNCPLVYGFWQKPLDEEMLIGLQKIWARGVL